MLVITLIAIGAAVVGLLGVALTLLGLPGTWLIVVSALGLEWWRPELLTWWTIGAMVALAGLGELLELAAGAAGAKRSGGSRSAALGAIVGGLVGGVAGTVLIPILVLGTIIGAVVGAGVLAGLMERGVAERTWRDAGRVAHGAARARFLAVILKSAIAALLGLVLVVAIVF